MDEMEARLMARIKEVNNKENALELKMAGLEEQIEWEENVTSSQLVKSLEARIGNLEREVNMTLAENLRLASVVNEMSSRIAELEKENEDLRLKHAALSNVTAALSQGLFCKNVVQFKMLLYADQRVGFLHSVISLTECIGIVRVGKYRVVCLCVCVSVCVSVCPR